MQRLIFGGLFGPLLFMLVVIVSALLRQEYSHRAQFISELGATNTSNAWLMNYGGFVPAGVLILLFGATLMQRLPRHWSMKVASVFVILFGTGIAASGLISCDPGCPQGEGSSENIVHNVIGPLTFLCLIIAAALFGINARRFPRWRMLWLYSIITSIVGLGLLVTLANSLDARVLTGLWQRLLLSTLFLWCAVLAIYASRQTRSAALDA